MHTPDIMLHVNEDLSTAQQAELEMALRDTKVVIAPRFNQPKLLVVMYNSDQTSSSKILNVARSNGYAAQIVGM